MSKPKNTIWTYYLAKFSGFLSALLIFSLIFYYLVWQRLALIDAYYYLIIAIIFLYYIKNTLTSKDYRNMMHRSGIKSYYLDGFKDFGHRVTAAVNFTLLSIVYFTIVALVSIFYKIRRKHFIDLKKKTVKSHWNDYNLSKKPFSSYFRQF